MFLFGEHVKTGALDLCVEALALAVIIVGVAALSHSHLIADADKPSSAGTVGYRPTAQRERVRQWRAHPR
jgi:hypothetical protein